MIRERPRRRLERARARTSCCCWSARPTTTTTVGVPTHTTHRASSHHFASHQRPPRSQHGLGAFRQPRRARVCVRQTRCRCPVGAVVNFPTPRRRGRCVSGGTRVCALHARAPQFRRTHSGAVSEFVCVQCVVFLLLSCVCVTRNTCELVRVRLCVKTTVWNCVREPKERWELR